MEFSQRKIRRAVVIGGSAGSIPVLGNIVSAIPTSFPIPLIICVHRMKTVAEGICEVLQLNARCPVSEPDDKAPVLPGNIYVAPSNYHLLVSPDFSFSLSTEEPVNYSRPAIDLTFYSAAKAYQGGLTGILLTGANKDGAQGLREVKRRGGYTIVQDPAECPAPFMPLAAIALQSVNQVLRLEQINHFLLTLK
jgi:two-component system, chemotaxis family, protein-glutamate methylesterase/glutaminase